MYKFIILFTQLTLTVFAQKVSFTHQNESLYFEQNSKTKVPNNQIQFLQEQLSKAKKENNKFSLYSLDIFGLMYTVNPYNSNVWNQKIDNAISAIETKLDDNGDIIMDTIFKSYSISDLFFGLNYHYFWNLHEQKESSELTHINVFRKDSLESIMNPNEKIVQYTPIFVLIPTEKVDLLLIKDPVYETTVIAKPFEFNTKEFSNSDLNFNVSINLFDNIEVEVTNYKIPMNINLFDFLIPNASLPKTVLDADNNEISTPLAMTVVDSVNVFENGKIMTVLDSIQLNSSELTPVFQIDLTHPLKANSLKFNGFEAGISDASRKRYTFKTVK